MRNYAVSEYQNGTFIVIDADTGETIPGGPYANAASARRRINKLKANHAFNDLTDRAAEPLIADLQQFETVLNNPPEPNAALKSLLTGNAIIADHADDLAPEHDMVQAPVEGIEPVGFNIGEGMEIPDTAIATAAVALEAGEPVAIIGHILPGSLMAKMYEGSDIVHRLPDAQKLAMSSAYGTINTVDYQIGTGKTGSEDWQYFSQMYYSRRVSRRTNGVYPQGRHFRRGAQYARGY